MYFHTAEGVLGHIPGSGSAGSKEYSVLSLSIT